MSAQREAAHRGLLQDEAGDEESVAGLWIEHVVAVHIEGLPVRWTGQEGAVEPLVEANAGVRYSDPNSESSPDVLARLKVGQCRVRGVEPVGVLRAPDTGT